MLREFAVEPGLLGDWAEFRYLHEKFGFSRARLIVKYPAKWPVLVLDAASGFTTAQRKTLELWLLKQKDFLVQSGREYNNGYDWLRNAETVDAQQGKSFRAILATQNPRNNEKVILPRDAAIEEHPLFSCPRECLMPRTPQGFIDVCGVLLKSAREVIFVDPKFSGAGRWGQTIKALFGCMRQDISVTAKLFTSVASLDAERHKIDDIKRDFKRFIPNGQHLEIVLLEHDSRKDHNRFLLTESGGIKFPWGLDVSTADSEDMVNLLDSETHQTAYKSYTELPDRTVLEIFSIEGTA